MTIERHVEDVSPKHLHNVDFISFHKNMSFRGKRQLTEKSSLFAILHVVGWIPCSARNDMAVIPLLRQRKKFQNEVRILEIFGEGLALCDITSKIKPSLRMTNAQLRFALSFYSPRWGEGNW